MLQDRSVRIIDISGLVRLRKHLSWSSNVMGALGGVGVVVAIDTPELRDAVYIGADGVLALVTFLVLFKGVVAAIAPLSIALVTLTTILTARFVAAALPIDTKDERGMLAVAVMAMAASLYVLAIGLAPFFRAGRRSPYLKLMFATNRTLGAD